MDIVTYGALNKKVGEKLSSNQGTQNAGKMLGINNEGEIQPIQVLGGNVSVTETLESGEDYSMVIEEGEPTAVTSVAGKYGTVTLDAGDIEYDEQEVYNSGTVGKEVGDLKSQLNSKYDKYTAEYVSGLALDMFAICPETYSITTLDNTDALAIGNVPTNTYAFSKLKNDYYDIKFKLNGGFFTSTSSSRIVLAATNSKAVALTLNAENGNIWKFTGDSTTQLAGVTRTTMTDDNKAAQGDTLHCVKNGSKVAVYLIKSGTTTEIPIFKKEWVDVVTAWPNEELTSSDVGFGIVTNRSGRNSTLIYDFSYFSVSGDHFMAYDEVNERLTALENGHITPNTVDLFMFMGQSNMAGRGTANQAPEVTEGAGYEFRAISDPTKLYPITEPFGVDENVQDAIYDYLGGYKAKTGDLVPAFVNAYYAHTGCPIVGVSASEGGTAIASWQPESARYEDAMDRFEDAVEYLEGEGYTIRHKYMLWCQGETNGDLGTSKADYKTAFDTMAQAWFTAGIETIFLIKIGNYNGESAYDYTNIMDAQDEICQETPNVVMVSTDFAGMKARDQMKDDWHYKQAAYNEVGTYAGINTAIYVNTGKEPTMYDTQDGSLYYTHKN